MKHSHKRSLFDKKDIPFASEIEQLSKIVLTYCNSKIVLEMLASITQRDHVM